MPIYLVFIFAGHLFSASGVNSATPLRSITVAGNLLPQTAEATPTVPGTVGSCPRRPGGQPGRQSVSRVRDPRVMGTQTRSKGVYQCELYSGSFLFLFFFPCTFTYMDNSCPSILEKSY